MLLAAPLRAAVQELAHEGFYELRKLNGLKHHPRAHLGETADGWVRWEIHIAGYDRAAAGFCGKLVEMLELTGPIYGKDENGKEFMIETSAPMTW